MNGPSAGLPEPARHRVAVSLDAACLARRDRAEIEAELAAHFEDGLAQGRDLESLLEDFGEPAAAGVLIGRSACRRRRSGHPGLRAARLFTLAVALAYAGAFARLHVGAPEESISPSPKARLAVLAPFAATSGVEDTRAAFETLLAAMYTKGEDGRLTAAGLRIYQALRGKLSPRTWAAVVEPAYFWNAARRGEVRHELDRFLRLAADTESRAFEEELARFRSSPGRVLRYAPLEIPLVRLAQVRESSRRSLR